MSIVRIAIGTVVALALATAGTLAAAYSWERGHADDHVVLIIIPRGTAVRQANGGDVGLPRSLALTVGGLDTLVVRNEDVWPAQVGPLRLQPGQTFRQRFHTPGTYDMLCATMYHKEQSRIVVRPPAIDPWSIARELVR